jgi:acyl carrier protein
MMALEQEFGIRIDVEDAIEMTSFPAICKTLGRYLGDVE